MDEVARRLGVDRRTISAMEAGEPQIAASIVAGALWVYGLERGFEVLADPDQDALGRSLEARDRPQVARRKAVDNDF